jgi:WD40 repeat protein
MWPNPKTGITIPLACFLFLLSAYAAGQTPKRESDNQTKQEVYTKKKFDCAIYTAAFSPDMRFLASGGSGICIWEIETGRLVKTFVAEPVNEAKSVEAVSVAFSPDHQTIATGLRDGTVRIWELFSGRQLKILKGPTSGLRAIRYSSNGQYIAAGGHDAVLHLWDTDTGEEIKTFEGHQGLIESVRFSPNNKRIVTAGYDGTARLWDIATGKQIGEFDAFRSAGSIRFAGFSPDGQRVYVAALDGSAAVWNIATNEQTKTADKRKERWGFAADLSPDGKMIIAGSDHGIIGLQSSDTWKDIKEFHDGDAIVRGITFAPDGNHFATVGYDDLLRLWDIEKSEPVRIFKN